MDFLNYDKTKLPSVILNPFEKTNITDINLYYSKKVFSSKMKWWGSVEFKNGLTEGTQKLPECDTFEEILNELKKIENSLK